MRLPTVAAAALMSAFPLAAFAQQNSVAADPCARYKRDVTQERGLFAVTPAPVTAGKDGRSAPHISTGRAYRVRLAPAAEVNMPVVPGNGTAPDGDYSGVLAFRAPAAGSYRVAVDQPMWIDVAADARLIPPTDYEGQHGCEAPRKIVEYTLMPGKPLILQLSSSSHSDVRVTIVRAAGH